MPAPLLPEIWEVRYGYMVLKTTLNVDDRLLRSAKKRAADEGRTLTSVVEDALRAFLSPRKERGGHRFRWVVVNDTGLPAVDIADRKALYDFMEREP